MTTIVSAPILAAGGVIRPSLEVPIVKPGSTIPRNSNLLMSLRSALLHIRGTQVDEGYFMVGNVPAAFVVTESRNLRDGFIITVMREGDAHPMSGYPILPDAGKTELQDPQAIAMAMMRVFVLQEQLQSPSVYPPRSYNGETESVARSKLALDAENLKAAVVAEHNRKHPKPAEPAPAPVDALALRYPQFEADTPRNVALRWNPAKPEDGYLLRVVVRQQGATGTAHTFEWRLNTKPDAMMMRSVSISLERIVNEGRLAEIPTSNIDPSHALIQGMALESTLAQKAGRDAPAPLFTRTDADAAPGVMGIDFNEQVFRDMPILESGANFSVHQNVNTGKAILRVTLIEGGPQKYAYIPFTLGATLSDGALARHCKDIANALRNLQQSAAFSDPTKGPAIDRLLENPMEINPEAMASSLQLKTNPNWHGSLTSDVKFAAAAHGADDAFISGIPTTARAAQPQLG